MSDKVILTPPLTDDLIRTLVTGDQVLVTGVIYTARDAAHKRLGELLEAGRELPVDFRGQILYYVGPSPARPGRVIGAAGPTTSTRMERFTPLLIEKYGVRGIIGKGGLLEGSMRAMMEHGACYLAIVGGAAALETTQIQEIEEVYWEDLMPECLWKFRVKGFGPLIVAMDSHGNNLYEKVRGEAKRRLPELYRSLGVSQ